jgi:hypothetical protein
MPTKRTKHPNALSKIKPPYRKKKIPKALREAVWLKYSGKEFETKCHTTWCPNRITAYDFQAGHMIPEKKGGPTTLENLIPLCSRCNLSMGHQYTYEEWCRLEGAPPAHWFWRYVCCFRTVPPAVPPSSSLPSSRPSVSPHHPL